MRSSLQTRLPSGASQSSRVAKSGQHRALGDDGAMRLLDLAGLCTFGPEVDSVHLSVCEPARALMRMVMVFARNLLHRIGTSVTSRRSARSRGRRSACFRRRLDTPSSGFSIEIDDEVRRRRSRIESPVAAVRLPGRGRRDSEVSRGPRRGELAAERMRGTASHPARRPGRRSGSPPVSGRS